METTPGNTITTTGGHKAAIKQLPSDPQERIATALERIATVMEREAAFKEHGRREVVPTTAKISYRYVGSDDDPLECWRNGASGISLGNPSL